MKEPSLFDQETKIIVAAEELLQKTEFTGNKEDYSKLLQQFKKLSKQFGRIVKNNDTQQKELKDSESNLKEEIKKRALIETQLREQQSQLEIAKEVAEQALRDKASFFASMSHEIRTPLNGVLGAAQLLETTELEPNQKGLINTILSSGKILLVVINDILDFSKIELGNLELESQPLDLDQTMEKVSELMALAAGEKELDFIIKPSLLPHLIFGDPTRLSQVLVNLISNAIKFTETGHVYVSTQIQENDGQKEILFTVEDTGLGISESGIQKLFKAFSQAEASTTRKFGGTGLGLSICAKITEQWGGKIWVTSKVGTGSRFFFTLPLVPSTEAAQTKPNYPNLKGKRVCIISPNPNVLALVADFCANEAMAPSSFSEPKDFFTELEKETQPDILVIDHNLAEAKVMQLTDCCKRLDCKIPILLMVSRGSAVAGQGLNKKKGCIIDKPIKHFTFLKAMDSLIKGETFEDYQDHRAPKEYEKLSGTIPLKILIAEDNITNQTIAKATFEIIGYAVDVAKNGKIALEMALKQNYDVIFMDMQMPVMGGVEATGLIKAAKKELAPLIIAMTANATDEDKIACLAAGMDHHFPKPLVIDQLIALLKSIFLKGGGSPNLATVKKEESPPNEELFDQKILTTLKQTYTDQLLIEVTDIYLGDFFDTINEIEKSFIENDLAQAQQLSHKLLGSSMNVGVKKASFHLFKLEEMAQNDQLEQLNYHLSELRKAALPTHAGLKTSLDL